MALIPLRAGPLEMTFDDANAFLRHIRLGDHEIVRGVFAAVRDRNWNTVPATVNFLDIARTDTGFELSLDVTAVADDIDFRWHGTVTGAEDGTVACEFDGAAQQPFKKNRIGLCVLHPIGPCAGRPCRVTHTDGSQTSGAFPLFISPHQPFKNIKAISHRVTQEITVDISFQGEVFEMEDQRNWTDASYKIYSTPLELPFPVQLEAGQRIRQSVTIGIDCDASSSKPRAATTRSLPSVIVNWHDPRMLASVGLGMATTGRKLGARAVELLAATQLAHLRVDLPLDTTDWRQRLRETTQLAAALKARLQIALFLSDAAERELDQLLQELSNQQQLSTQRPAVGLWMIFHSAEKATGSQWVELARRKLAAWDPTIALAAGTNAYFAELNRERPQTDCRTFVCFSINPQVHASDNLSLVESLGAQRSTVETARQFSAHPVVISPITLRPRFNPNATETTAEPMPQSDRRQSTPFAAAWTVGSLARLASCPGVHSLTYYETAGPRGILDEEGRPFPMYHVFRAIAGYQAAYDCHCDQPLRVGALALRAPDGRRRVLLASFFADPQTILLRGVAGDACVRPLGPEGFTAGEFVCPDNGGLEVKLPSESVMMVELEYTSRESLGSLPASIDRTSPNRSSAS